MARRYKHFKSKVSANQSNPNSEPLTFGKACRQLWKVIKFKTLPSKYLNKKVRYKGKWYKIEGETADFFFIHEYPKQSFSKEGNKYPIR